MKKAIALLATLVVLTGTTFAQLAPTITATAETKWGVNLDADNATGFENDADISVIIPITSEGAQTDGAHSTISLTGVELTIELDGDDTGWDTTEQGDLEAKILLGDAFVALGNNEGTQFNFAETSMDYYDIHANKQGYAGIAFGYATDMFNATVNVNSRLGYETDDGSDNEVTYDESDFFMEVSEETDKTDKDVNEDNEYNFGIVGGITPMEMFNVDFGFATYGEKDSAAMMMAGAKAYGTIMEGLTYAIPFDYVSVDYDADGQDNSTGMELHPSVSYTANGLTAGLGFYQLNVKNYMAEPDYALHTDEEYAIDNDKDSATYGQVVLTETSDYKTYADSAFVEEYTAQILNLSLAYGTDMFNAGLAVDLTLFKGVKDAKDTEEQAFTLTGDVTPVAGLKLYTEASYTVKAVKDTNKFELVNVGAQLTSELTGIENTTFIIQYEGLTNDEDMSEKDASGIFYVGASITL